MTTENARLIITDGTKANTESLLVNVAGANLIDFIPKSPQPINTIWASSPYSDGKHIIDKTLDNIIDTFVIDIHTLSQDNTIKKLRRFLLLCEQGIKYWKDEYSTHKFWLEIRAKCETEIRYAYVVDYGLPETNNPFDAPFEQDTGGSTLEELQLSIEHTIWTDSLTIGANCVKTTDGNNGPLHDWSSSSDVPTQSTDDATISGGAAISTVTAVSNIGADATPNPYGSGIRFRGVGIPAMATVKSAYLILLATANDAGATCNVRIKGEKVLAPAVFSTYANYVGRVRTTAFVDWSAIPAWTAGSQYYTPDIKAVIQEIINQVGWVTNNDIVIFLDDNGSSASATRRFSSWDGATDPILIIEWEDTSRTHFIGNNTESCARRTFIQNHWRSQNITHIFIDDGGVFGVNQVSDHAGAWFLMPALPAINDATYFGIAGDAGVGDIFSSTFNSLVFDLLVAAGSIVLALEYWNGAIWTTLGSTQPKLQDIWVRNTGPQQVLWELPADWVECVVQGIWGWWVRLRVTNNPLAENTPQQRAHTIPFTISWNSIKVSASEITGDINAYINFLLAGDYGQDMTEKFVIGIRKASRDADSTFQSIFPLTEFMEHGAGISVDLVSAIAGGQDSRSYYGTHAYWTEAGVITNRYLARLILPYKSFAGRYRVFVRCRGDAGTAIGEFAFSIIANSLKGSTQTDYFYNKQTNAQEVIDCGLIEFPSEIIYEDPPDALAGEFIQVELMGKSLGAIHVHLYDIIIIPVDEMYMEVTNPLYFSMALEDFAQSWKIITSNLKAGPYGFRYYKNTVASIIDDFYVIHWDTQYINAQLKVSSLGPFQLEPEEEYYIHFFIYTDSTLNTDRIFQCLTAPSMDKNQRYLLMRGAE